MKIRFIFSVPYVELRDYLGQSITNLKAVMVAAWDKLCVHTWPIAVSQVHKMQPNGIDYVSDNVYLPYQECTGQL